MARSLPGMVREFGASVEALAGKAIRNKVMQGSETITVKTEPLEAARWMKEAVGRLDGLVDGSTRAQIMERCGKSCLRANRTMIDQAKIRRKRYATLDEFLAGEQKKPLTGTRLERRGNVLYHTYTPRDFVHPMRCFCALARALPEKEQMPATYCLCSKAFIGTYWEEVLGKPVKVEVLGTALTGSRECRFKIEILP